MTLLDLLTVMVFAEPIAVANGEVKVSGAGIAEHIVATVVGVFVGFTCAWGVRKSGYALASRSEQSSRTEEEWTFKTTVLLRTTTVVGLVLSLLLAGLLGDWAMRPFMRFLH